MYSLCMVHHNHNIRPCGTSKQFPTKNPPGETLPPLSTPDPPNLLARARPGRCPAEAEEAGVPYVSRTGLGPTTTQAIVACKAQLGLSACVHPPPALSLLSHARTQ